MDFRIGINDFLNSIKFIGVVDFYAKCGRHRGKHEFFHVRIIEGRKEIVLIVFLGFLDEFIEFFFGSSVGNLTNVGVGGEFFLDFFKRNNFGIRFKINGNIDFFAHFIGGRR